MKKLVWKIMCDKHDGKGFRPYGWEETKEEAESSLWWKATSDAACCNGWEFTIKEGYIEVKE